jgi:hypothetical protein
MLPRKFAAALAQCPRPCRDIQRVGQRAKVDLDTTCTDALNCEMDHDNVAARRLVVSSFTLQTTLLMHTGTRPASDSRRRAWMPIAGVAVAAGGRSASPPLPP